MNEFKIKNGLLVSGSITGVTESGADNSAKMASTSWVRDHVTASIGGAIKTTQAFTATAGQTTFTIAGGYTIGLIDVYINGAFLNSSSYTAINGTTVVLTDAAALNDIIDVLIFKQFQGSISSSDQIPEGVTNLYYTNARVAAYLTANSYATQSYVTTATSTLVPQTRTITINGEAYDLSANRSWTIAGGVTSFNTRTGAITLISGDVTTALGFTPVTNARTITINGTTFDLTVNRTYTVSGTFPSGGTAGQILSKLDATDYNTIWIDNFASQLKHDVKLGATIAKGKAVYVSSADGTNMIVSVASNATEATSSKTLGLVETGGVLNDIVKVVTEGLLAGLNTSTATVGDPVWLGTNGDLIFGLTNKPYAPAHLVFIGVVTRVQTINGEIFVKVQNGFEMHELHNVSALNPANNDILAYNTTTSLWEKNTIIGTLGYTPYNATNPSGYITGITSGMVTTALSFTPYNSTNPAGYTTNTGTVTSVLGTGSVSGLTLSGTVTTSGSLTLGGTLSLTSGNVTTALGFTPYNSTNPNSYVALGSAITGYTVGANTALAATDSILGAFNKIQGQLNGKQASGSYLTSYTETSTLANVTARGATTNGAITVNGDITISAGASSNIYMSDTDEGQRQIHCNSNRIGFLTQGGGWGSYCNDDGSWVSVSDITAFSDVRTKENISTVNDALDTVLQLRGVYYNRIGEDTRSLGVIAQETQPVLPEVVKEQNDGMLSVAYGNMAGLFIEAFKEQQVQLIQQKAQIDELIEIVKTLKGL